MGQAGPLGARERGMASKKQKPTEGVGDGERRGVFSLDLASTLHLLTLYKSPQFRKIFGFPLIPQIKLKYLKTSPGHNLYQGPKL